MCENFRKLIVRKNCKIGAVECDKLDKLFIKHSHTPGGWEKNSHTCVKFQDIRANRETKFCCFWAGVY